MMFKTHLTISLLTAMIILPLFTLNKGVFLLIFLLGAIFPDIDIPTSVIGRRARLLGWLFSHRGIFHSLPMLLLLSAIIWVVTLNPLYAFVFSLGYALHLGIDMLNHKGIRPFFPLKFRIKGFIKTNSITEQVIFAITLVAGFILLLK